MRVQVLRVCDERDNKQQPDAAAIAEVTGNLCTRLCLSSPCRPEGRDRIESGRREGHGRW